MSRSIFNFRIFKNIRSFFVFLITIPVKLYQYLLSPFLMNSCRFKPTCSEYAIQAFKTRGVFTGLYLTVWRLIRCNPWGGHGYDPVPPPGTSILKKFYLKSLKKISGIKLRIKHFIFSVKNRI